MRAMQQQQQQQQQQHHACYKRRLQILESHQSHTDLSITNNNMQTFAVLSLVLAAAVAAPSSPYRPAPYHPAPAPYHPAPSYAPGPAVYNYGYAVKDDYAGVDFDANEERNGYATNGGYSVLLPDGRRQIVTYTVADDYSGYVADVRYEGYAQPYHPAPAPYHPAPAPYHPRPYQG